MTAFDGEMGEVLKTGANIQVKNQGHHWIITHGPVRIDYWPSSERYQITFKSSVKRGFKDMLRELVGPANAKKERG